MKYKLEVLDIYEFGKRKDADGNPHQEDSMYPPFGKSTANDRLFIVCDGMGGHDSGEVASATVCEAMSNTVLRLCPDAEGEFSEEIFNHALNDAFDALDSHDTHAQKKMGTTMTFLKLYNKGYFIAHMGDSRVYHLRPGEDKESTQILHVTRDHSLVNDLVAIGEITPEEAMTHRQRNVITRAMQPNMECRPRADTHFGTDVRAGDYFYLCTDGMLEEMSDDNIRFLFSAKGGTIEEKREKLIALTKDNKDNHTAILVHIIAVDEETVELSQTGVEDAEDKMEGEVSHEGEISDDDTEEVKWVKQRKTKCFFVISAFLLVVILLLGVLLGRGKRDNSSGKPFVTKSVGVSALCDMGTAYMDKKGGTIL